MQIEWQTTLAASAAHAAWCCGLHGTQKPGIVGFTEDEIAAGKQMAELVTRQVQADLLWEQLHLSQEPKNQPLSDAFEDWSQRFLRRFPNFSAEAELRAGPFVQQWEAYGPGLMAWVQRCLGTNVQVANVFLVQPVLGGYGRRLRDANIIIVESMLTNEVPQLPEVLRLIWLLSQASYADMWRKAKNNETNESNALHLDKFALASIPLVLNAAEELGITTCDVTTVDLAMEHWYRKGIHNTEPQATASQLIAWWQSCDPQHLTAEVILRLFPSGS